MSKAKQKEIELLKELKEKRENQYRAALKRILQGDETLRISLDFAQQCLSRPIDEPLEEYSPIHISRMVFQKQLASIRTQFEKLPGGQCRIEHFIAIMLKVMRFPFDKAPLFMVGLKDMFYEVAEDGRDAIQFEKFFKYIVGELVTLRQEEQNTEFQVHFQESKKQDYLLHDNGIRRAIFTPDLKVVMSLDERENMIKFYDHDMRNIQRFQGRKEIHYGKNPMILDFDYSEMTMRLGIIFPDSVIQSIHLPNFLHKVSAEFEQSSLNQLSFTMACRMKRIYYIQMLNKWLTVSEEDNQVYLYDMEKARSKPEQVEERASIDNNDLNISIVLEIVTISTICFVAGNQITFYNESLTQKKFAKFSHHEIITNLKYSQQSNTFYLTGRQQKVITMFTISRNHQNFKIRTFAINKIITDFQVFPHFQTILISDQSHDLRLIHQPSKTVYQHQSLANIVKLKDKHLKIQKTSKTEFIIFQTYMLNFALQKVAIEKEIQYNFLPYYYFDNRKDEFFISVNNQIISFSLIFGEIRKNYSLESSNISKHECFFLGTKTTPFIIDSSHYLYQIYMKSAQIEGQNKNYKKKVPLLEIVGYFYDEEMRSVMIINQNSVLIIRNDYNNNFNTVNTIHFQDIGKITGCTFCKKTKYLTFITSDHIIYQLKNFSSKFSKGFKFNFLRGANDAEEKIIIQHQYCSRFQVLVMLNNRNEIIIAERLNISNHIVIKLDEYLPYKLKYLNFNRFTYHISKEKNIDIPSLLLYDDTGFLMDINLQKLFISKFSNTKKEEIIIRTFLCQSYEISSEALHIQSISINLQNKVKLVQGQFWLQKAHEKQIMIGTKLLLQIPTILTISKDGIIKLWNQKYTILFVLKIPILLKLTWNMKQIQSIKNQKSINQLKNIILQNYSQKNREIKPFQAINKTKKIKHYVEPIKKFKFSQDLPLEIESKQIEDIVMQEEDYRKSFQTYRGLKSRLKFNPQLSNTIDVHPWRNRKQFVRIYEKASPPHKYNDKIPKDLLTLRTSLDMSERKKKAPNYRLAESILPQLKAYQNEKAQHKKQTKKQTQKQDLQNFQSCLYIKTGRRKKKANQLDQIDRQFLKKQIALQNRRWIPRLGRQKAASSIQMGESTNLMMDQNRYDTIRDIQSVFQQHNKQCSELGRGRIIQITKINLIKDYI